MHVSPNNVDTQILRYRDATARLFETHPENQARTRFTNPGPDGAVRAEDLLAHLELDLPQINRILKQAYPYLDRNPGLKEAVHARIRFLAWMTLRGHVELAAAYRELEDDPEAARRLGFTWFPKYDTIRECLYDRLGEALMPGLIRALLREQKRLLPTLGEDQVEDATPLPARPRDQQAPYNGHYKTRMRKLELRWDHPHEALLAHAFYGGTEDEEPYAEILGRRLEDAGIHAQALWVDNGYTSFQAHAAQFRRGTRLIHRPQEDWRVDEPGARADVAARAQKHWRHPDYPVEGSLLDQARFLVDHGSQADREAVGRWVRDRMLADPSSEEAAALRARRSRNEALNGRFKLLPTGPPMRGARAQYGRVLACVLTVHMVQLTRLQNGVRHGLCRTRHIV